MRIHTLQRLGQLQALDAHSPPWIRSEAGRERIDTVVRAWSGLLEIDVELPDVSAGRADQWHVAAQIIEEGLANSARHGDATHVSVVVQRDGDALSLHLLDDGTNDARAGSPGLGMRWLDRVAPGEWSLQATTDGVMLAVRIR